jgi:hypothetical protein
MFSVHCCNKSRQFKPAKGSCSIQQCITGSRSAGIVLTVWCACAAAAVAAAAAATYVQGAVGPMNTYDPDSQEGVKSWKIAHGHKDVIGG